MTRKEISSLAIVVLIGLLLQVGLIALDCNQTPYKTAVSYVEARYGLSPSMTQYLCSDSNESNCPVQASTNPQKEAEDFIYNATADAAQRGFEMGYAKYALSNIESHTEYLNDTTAVVHLTATCRKAINPLYTLVARLFRIGKTYEVDESVCLTLEDGQWRVCSESASMM